MRLVIGDNLDFYRDSARVGEREFDFVFIFRTLNHRHIRTEIDILRLATQQPKIKGGIHIVALAA